MADSRGTGRADAILNHAGCYDAWVGTADVTVDPAGRVRTLDLKDAVARPACRNALETLLRLSFATNTSLRSGFTGPILLVRSVHAPVCLDEDSPQAMATSTFRAGGAVQVPKVRKRVQPIFPRHARRVLAGKQGARVVVEAVISKHGCVRSLRVIEQSADPELNGAAVMALSQWTFTPGSYDGKPVDVLFTLTINFLGR
jgi:TonB family protein